MAYDQKQFLDLLQEYKSDETKKARRNASAIAFVILGAWILGVRLADIRFLGLDISKTAELPVLGLAGVLLVYWTIMFLISWKHDKEIQKERSWFLSQEVAKHRARLTYIEEKYDEQRRQRQGWPIDYGDVKSALELYDAQRTRTKRAALFGRFINYLEAIVPLLLVAAAAVVLIVGVVRVL